jgi:NAD-dependent DNA ligase
VVIVRPLVAIGVAFAGKELCITGQFACGWTRKDAKQRVVAHGGVPLDDVTSGCSLLVMAGRTGPLAASDFRTQKARSALALGIEVIGEDEFRRRVGD